MTAIDREPGGSTMIRVSWEVRDMIEQEKIIPREPLNDCIKRGILENRKHRQHPSIETKEQMESDIKNFVLNPEIPDTVNDHREIFKQAHPEEPLTQNDLIHHINGNHNDNRIENLKKVSAQEHADAHAQMNKEFPQLKSPKSNVIVGRDI